MKAFRFFGVDKGLLLQDLPIPQPGDGEVLIKVEAAGLCHSDTHVIHGGGGAWMRALPITLGHEIAGTVMQIGPNQASDHFQIGHRVAVACVGHPIEERDFNDAAGVGRDGGYAEFVVVGCKYLVEIPDNVTFAQAAVATDSIATAYHAVVTEGKVHGPLAVAVIGLGGLGLNGVAIAALQGASVYGVDINEAKFEQAKDFGASECATNLAHFSKSFDVVLDFAGASATVQSAISAVRPGGTVVLVGLASQTIQITTSSLVTQNISLRGSTSASIEELREVFKLLGSGALKPRIQEVAFEDVPDALQQLGTNEVLGRLFTIPK